MPVKKLPIRKIAKEPVARPTAPIMPPVNPPIAPIKKPNFLPNFCIKFERGEAVNIEPSTIIEIGRVAKHAFEAKDWPANPPTVKIIGICEPSMAWAHINTATLRFAN